MSVEYSPVFEVDEDGEEGDLTFSSEALEITIRVDPQDWKAMDQAVEGLGEYGSGHDMSRQEAHDRVRRIGNQIYLAIQRTLRAPR